MSETTENTFSAYLGPEFQQRLMWQLLVEPEFAEKIIPDLAVEYFDEPNLKRLFIIILEFYKEFEKVPNLQNQSIHQAINKYKTPNNVIEEESLFAVIKRIELWNERVINKQMLHDGDVVQKTTNNFIKQQEYRKLAESILTKVKNGDIKSKHEISHIEEKFQKIAHIGDQEDDCEELTEGVDKALRKEFRQTIPTGIGTIDSLTGGGLGRGEMGLILTPSGVGKTTALTIIANTAYELEKNVAQIIFEDTKDQIKRKHYTIWAKSALSRLDEEEENERVKKVIHEKVKTLEGKGRLVIKKFSQENTTMMDVRNWMIGYQKKWGFKFDILVLDYLDCLESHKKSPDRNEAELAIVKGFEALASDFDIPAWSAIQSNRTGFGAEFVEANQSGGSIKRIQKAHFFMSVAKTPEQQEANFANIRIIKARFAKDGQTFEDCIYNNDTMQIIIDDPRYKFTKTFKSQKHHDEKDVDKLEANANKMHEVLSKHSENILKDIVNNDEINNGAISEAEKLNRLLRMNAANEFLTESSSNTEDKTVIIKPEIPEELLVIDDSEYHNTLADGEGDDWIKPEETNENIVIKESFEWTGDTETVNTNEKEVKLEDIPIIPQVNENKILTEKSQKKSLHEIITSEIDLSNIEKNLIFDPDEEQGEYKNTRNILDKLRKNQEVIKKK